MRTGIRADDGSSLAVEHPEVISEKAGDIVDKGTSCARMCAEPAKRELL